jgi:prepilin-type N-terminal cleavage/methylation domain-containing protein
VIPRGRSLRGRIRRLSGAEGFSLTEVLVASILMLVVLAAVYGIWFGLQRTYSFVDEDMRAQSEARTALNEMVELIRTAREPEFAVADELDLVIVRAEPNLLLMWSDVDRDPAHDLELVRYRVDTEERTLYRDVSQTGDDTFETGTTTRLVGHWVTNNGDDPDNWLYSYQSMDGTTLAMTEDAVGDPPHVEDPTQIREVQILLLVDVVVGKSPEHHELISVVQPRNLRTY